MRSYPVPSDLQAEAGGPSMRLGSIEALAASGSEAMRLWSSRIVSGERKAIERRLIACACDPDADHYGILHPDMAEPLVVSVVAIDADRVLRRWNGSGWDEVPPQYEPSGFDYVSLNDGRVLADALGAVAAGGLLLRPTRPKIRIKSPVLAAGVSPGKYFAIVDDFDTSALLDLLEVRPGPVALRRNNGKWVRDGEVLARLRSVDPPRVIQIDPAAVDSLVASIDEFDRSHADEDPALTAAAWDESKFKRAGGKFADKAVAASPAARKQAMASQRAKYRDKKFDVVTAKADLAENKRRAEFDDQIREAFASIDQADPEAATAEEARLRAEVRDETKRREQYSRSAQFASKAEEIRRMETELDAAKVPVQEHVDRLPQAPEGESEPVAAAATPEHSMMPRELKSFWVRGKGAAKIRWGTGGDFNRCRRAMTKYMRPDQVAGACANLHKAATGTWPGKNRKHGVRASAEPMPKAAGIALRAEDTGRILLLQRSLDPSDSAAGKWEFPGGCLEEGEHPFDAARREWCEETGTMLPQEAKYLTKWESPNGVYQGFVMTVPAEDVISINGSPEHREVLNPDDPDQDGIEVVAWWDPSLLPGNPALRDEVQDTDWLAVRA